MIIGYEPRFRCDNCNHEFVSRRPDRRGICPKCMRFAGDSKQEEST